MPQETYSYDGASDFNSSDMHEDAMPDKREFDAFTGEELPGQKHARSTATPYEIDEYDREKRNSQRWGDSCQLELPSDILEERGNYVSVRIPYYMDIYSDSGKNLSGATFLVRKSDVAKSPEKDGEAGVSMSWITLNRDVRLTKWSPQKKAVCDLDNNPLPKIHVTDRYGSPKLDDSGNPIMRWDYSAGTVLPARELEKALRPSGFTVPDKLVSRVQFDALDHDYNWVSAFPGMKSADGKDMTGFRMRTYTCAPVSDTPGSDQSVWVPRGASVEFSKFSKDGPDNKVLVEGSEIAKAYELARKEMPSITLPRKMIRTWEHEGRTPSHQITIPRGVVGSAGEDLGGCRIENGSIFGFRPASDPELANVTLMPSVEVNRTEKRTGLDEKGNKTESWVRVDSDGKDMEKVEAEINGEKRLVWPSSTYEVSGNELSRQIKYEPVDVPEKLAAEGRNKTALVKVPAGCVDANGANISGWWFTADHAVPSDDGGMRAYVNVSGNIDMDIMRKTENGWARFDPQGKEIPHLLDEDGNEIAGAFEGHSATLRGSEIVAAFDDFAERSGHAATQSPDSPELDREAVRAKSIDTNRTAPEQDSRPKAL